MTQVQKILLFLVFPAFHKSSDQKSFNTFVFLPFLTPENTQIHYVKHVRRQKPTSPSLPQKRRVSLFLWFFNRNCLVKFGAACYTQPIFIIIPKSKPKHESSTEVTLGNVNACRSWSASSPPKQKENGRAVSLWATGPLTSLLHLRNFLLFC